jgi:hypothetical protein
MQQLAEPDEICKTSIPGSNPGGASKLPQQIMAFRFLVKVTRIVPSLSPSPRSAGSYGIRLNNSRTS